MTITDDVSVAEHVNDDISEDELRDYEGLWTIVRDESQSEPSYQVYVDGRHLHVEDSNNNQYDFQIHSKTVSELIYFVDVCH